MTLQDTLIGDRRLASISLLWTALQRTPKLLKDQANELADNQLASIDQINGENEFPHASSRTPGMKREDMRGGTYDDRLDEPVPGGVYADSHFIETGLSKYTGLIQDFSRRRI